VKETHEKPIELKCIVIVTVTASNGESAKEVMLRKCQTSSSSNASNFPSSKQELLSRTLKPFPPSSSSVVLSSHLQMDSNLSVSSTTYLSLNQQSTNGEHPDQLIDYAKHQRLLIVHTRQSVTGLFYANFS